MKEIGEERSPLSTLATGGAETGGSRCQIDVDGGGRFYWRLTARNGRVVAVSATSFGDYTSCLRDIGRLRAGLPPLLGGVQHNESGNGWVWLARDASGRAVAVSARPYERHSTCQAAYDRFRALLAELAVNPAGRQGGGATGGEAGEDGEDSSGAGNSTPVT